MNFPEQEGDAQQNLAAAISSLRSALALLDAAGADRASILICHALEVLGETEGLAER